MSLRERIHAFRYPNAQTRVVSPSGNVSGKFAAHVAGSSALRRRTTTSGAGSIITPHEQAPKRGMWVRYSDRTGVLTNLEAGDIATVMLVDDVKGENVVEVHVPAAQLRQAYFDEIPAARRPTYDAGARLGYVRKA